MPLFRSRLHDQSDRRLGHPAGTKLGLDFADRGVRFLVGDRETKYSGGIYVDHYAR